MPKEDDRTLWSAWMNNWTYDGAIAPSLHSGRCAYAPSPEFSTSCTDPFGARVVTEPIFPDWAGDGASLIAPGGTTRRV